MTILANIRRMDTSTTGTGSITLGSAVSGYKDFGSGLDGKQVTYVIEDGTSREIGRGVYTHSTKVLTRSVLESTSSDAAITLSGSAEVFIDAAAEDFVPTGAMITWPTSTVPTGFLERDGAAVSRTTYANLFAVIGTDYGSGDGSTTFNLPDHRGSFSRYWDHGAGNDPDAASRTDRGDATTGDNVGTEQDHELQSHSHDILGALNGQSGSNRRVVNTASVTVRTTNATGGNETRPINHYEMPIIKY